MKARIHPTIATILTITMLTACTTPNNQSPLSLNNPCPPGGTQFANSPGTTFVKQVILNPLASIGGTLLATAAANYSQKYTLKLNSLLTKLVTPKKKKKKDKSNQQVVNQDFTQGQPDFNTGFPTQTIDPNTGLPIQTDPNTGLPVQIDPTTGLPVQTDPNTGLPVQIDPTTGLPVQTDPNTGLPVQIDPTTGLPVQIDPTTGLPVQIDPTTGLPVQIDPTTGLPVQIDPTTGLPVQTDPNTGLPVQIDPTTGLPVQIDPTTGLPITDQTQFPQDPNVGQPFFGEPQQGGFDPNFPNGIQPRGVPGQQPHAIFSSNPCDPQQTQPFGQDPNLVQQGQGSPYDPYAQQGYPQDPYAQQGYSQDPYAQQAYPQNQYAQAYPTDPYAQQGYPSDPYAQQGYSQDPYAPQQTYSQDPYAQTNPTDPYAQQGYQSDPYAQTSYPQDPNAASTYPTQTGETGGYDSQNSGQPHNDSQTGLQTEQSGSPIGLDVVMVKKTIRNGAPVVLPIKDGDVLKDGRGNAAAGDKFRIMFRPATNGFVYVIAIDGSGWAQGLFPPPTSPLANPVKAGEQYVIPEGNNWFSLDQYKGIETIFFVVSPEKRQDIEEILQSITGRERPASENPKQVTKVAMIPYGVGRAKPSATPFKLPNGSGENQTIIPTSYFSQKAGQDLRLTRWFRHE